jgi:CRISPR-associated endonuclease Cas2|tara:strand:+ start:606 stop:905 length:300 start_codon:yes stop_codon:yes gene_type:complete
MNYILSYDITDNKLRSRLSKKLITLGCFRLQKSVFIGANFSVKEIKQLKSETSKILASKLREDSDSFLCLPLTGTQKKEMWWLKPDILPTFEFDNAILL